MCKEKMKETLKCTMKKFKKIKVIENKVWKYETKKESSIKKNGGKFGVQWESWRK